MKHSLLLLPCLVAGILLAQAQETEESFIVNFDKNDERLFLQPNGPFAVLAFTEDAFALHIGVIYYATMGMPLDGDWSLGDRFWQEERWNSDVVNCAWGKDGRTLFVATSGVYGSGSVYQLDLMARRSEVLFPSAAFPDPAFGGARMTRIIGISATGIQVLAWNEHDPTVQEVYEIGTPE